MRVWTFVALSLSLSLAVSLPALAEGHAGDPTPCESDADCGAYHVCVEGHAGDDEVATSVIIEAEDSMAEPMSCESDADCNEGVLCVDDYCIGSSEAPEEPVDPEEDEAPSMFCAVDLDALPSDPACESMCNILVECPPEASGSGSSRGSEGGASSSGFAPEPAEGSGEDDGAEDMPAADVPMQTCESTDDCDLEDAECVDGFCVTEWSHSEGEEPTEMPIELSPEEVQTSITLCMQMCNYSVYLEAGVEELASLNACFEEAAGSETFCGDACASEGEAWGAAIESAGVLEGLEHAQGGGDFAGSAESAMASESEMSGDDSGSSLAADGAEKGADGTEGAESSSEDEGGCNSSHGPMAPVVLMVALLSCLVVRRRVSL